MGRQQRTAIYAFPALCLTIAITCLLPTTTCSKIITADLSSVVHDRESDGSRPTDTVDDATAADIHHRYRRYIIFTPLRHQYQQSLSQYSQHAFSRSQTFGGKYDKLQFGVWRKLDRDNFFWPSPLHANRTIAQDRSNIHCRYTRRDDDRSKRFNKLLLVDKTIKVAGGNRDVGNPSATGGRHLQVPYLYAVNIIGRNYNWLLLSLILLLSSFAGCFRDHIGVE